QNPSNNKIKAELPSQNFKDGAYNLSVTERMYLSLKKDVVIVSAIYNTTEEKQQLMQFRNLTENFNGRVYFSVVKASNSEVANKYAITETPKILLFGYKTSRRQVPAAVKGEITEKNVVSTICSTMNKWGEVATYCTSN
ncbi:MAG: hypothetical protein ABEK04_02435, partial [Candidatus Nanohalobium sp.]